MFTKRLTNTLQTAPVTHTDINTSVASIKLN